MARGNTLVENARLFALLNVAQADAYFAIWDAKYTYNFWRPVTAIRAADTDPNPATSPDPGWTPLLVTPNFPSYVSGHSGHSAAAAAGRMSIRPKRAAGTATQHFTDASLQTGVAMAHRQ
ncbi:MAG TPA: hypothetical protein VH682_01105 [Gemmataceae bacterium]